MQQIRRIGAALIIVAAIAIWFGMAPDRSGTPEGYRSSVAQALADDAANNKLTEGAPQQSVVNGWTAKDLLTVIAREGAEPVDERPAALLTLLAVGFGFALATRPTTTVAPQPHALPDDTALPADEASQPSVGFDTPARA